MRTFNFSPPRSFILPDISVPGVGRIYEVDVIKPSRTVNSAKLYKTLHTWSMHASVCNTWVNPIWDNSSPPAPLVNPSIDGAGIINVHPVGTKTTGTTESQH
jgi:hypothetical protein